MRLGTIFDFFIFNDFLMYLKFTFMIKKCPLFSIRISEGIILNVNAEKKYIDK